MCWLYFLCAISTITGFSIVVARPFIPFDGMILIAVGVILPVQALLLRWVQGKLKEANRR